MRVDRLPTITQEHLRIATHLYDGYLNDEERHLRELQDDIESLVRSIVNGDSVVVPRKDIIEAAQDLYDEAAKYDSPLLTIRDDDSVEFGEGVSQGEIIRGLMAATAKQAMLHVAESVDTALQSDARVMIAPAAQRA
jgi:hypothetical protein